MSQVRVKDRGFNNFQIFLKARNLSVHTDTIIINPKVFECKSAIDINFLKEISTCARAIYMNCWIANNVRVTNKKSYLRRNQYQQDALAESTKLLAYIDLARQKFHLRNKKYLYWKDCCLEVNCMIKSWKTSDNERYKQYRS